ncbi:hypothetical protein AMATHDRAFT_890 [Amanita thiersii Skay4041]|uniref:Uncharacterized protein n=1 Tax=Amanita thiersii Skay4041 TaxID=703135 RepID=A0A2A9NZS1_9AGAR|nr:hypothetical protein AMATHDRAFT_890 [Amanita thiersii Skay4041]
MDNTNPSDSVSSLRAAALSTLRSKRRKPGLDKPIMSRPPPPESIQLDYGEEEQSPVQANQPAVFGSPTPPSRPTSTMKGSKHIHEDIQMREEGEISDEESTPVVHPPKEIRRSPSPRTKIIAARPKSPPHFIAMANVEDQPSTPSRHIFDLSPVPPVPTRPRSSTPTGPISHLSPIQRTLLALDPNHVRPGLQMSQEQYDLSKDIILDLLGWGISPEYLVDCGLSREVVFYVFGELNLRLPHNLDTTGLIHYTPERLSLAREAAGFSPIPGAREPYRPLPIPDHITKSIQASLARAASLSSVPDISSNNDLHDMEMQRRQELLARKRAVILSRKVKQSSSLSTVPSSSGESVLSTPDGQGPSTSPADVDDFLKSISPKTPEAIATLSSTFAPVPSQSNDVMDVDDIPGLGGLRPLQTDRIHRTQSDAGDPAPSSEDHALISPSGSAHPIEEVANSVVDPRDILSPASLSMGFTRDIVQRPVSEPHVVRRVSKRPVASDFVDFDTNPRLSVVNGSGYGGGGGGGGGANLNPIVRRKAAVIDFGGVSNSSRRCVIDLSDSEEEDISLVQRSVEHDPDRGIRGISYTPGFSGARGSVDSDVPSVVSTPSAMTPGAIIEPSQLELEIQKMKELIAKKEQDRLRKLASRSNNLGSESASNNGSLVRPQSEELITSFHTKGSPDHSDGRESTALNHQQTNDVEFHNEHSSSNASVVSVAAALVAASTSTSASTTPAIGSLVSRFIAQPTAG